MLVFNHPFFLLNVLIWSNSMLRINISTVLKSELNWLHKNVQHFDPRCLESREMHKTKKTTTLRDTLYIKGQLSKITFEANMPNGGWRTITAIPK